MMECILLKVNNQSLTRSSSHAIVSAGLSASIVYLLKSNTGLSINSFSERSLLVYSLKLLFPTARGIKMNP